MLRYRDRGAALDPQYTQKITPENNGRFMSTMMLNGRVVGTWRRMFKKDVAIISMEPFVTLSKTARQAFAEATRRYSQFIGMPVIVGG